MQILTVGLKNVPSVERGEIVDTFLEEVFRRTQSDFPGESGYTSTAEEEEARCSRNRENPEGNVVYTFRKYIHTGKHTGTYVQLEPLDTDLKTIKILINEITFLSKLGKTGLLLFFFAGFFGSMILQYLAMVPQKRMTILLVSFIIGGIAALGGSILLVPLQLISAGKLKRENQRLANIVKDALDNIRKVYPMVSVKTSRPQLMYSSTMLASAVFAIGFFVYSQSAGIEGTATGWLLIMGAFLFTCIAVGFYVALFLIINDGMPTLEIFPRKAQKQETE